MTTTAHLGLTLPASGTNATTATVTEAAANLTLIDDQFDPSTGHDHDGTDSKKVRATNLDVTGLTALQFVRVNAGGTALETTPATLLMASKAFADTPYTVPAWGYHVDVDASGGAVTVVLPTAVGNGGSLIEVRKTDSSANLVTVDASGAETINGAATLVIYGQNDSYSLRSDGTGVLIV